MPRIRIPRDWECRANRALSNLNEPGVGAVCFGAAINTVAGSTARRPNRLTCSNARSTRRTASGKCRNARTRSQSPSSRRGQNRRGQPLSVFPLLGAQSLSC
jgi:hypothetical protein